MKKMVKILVTVFMVCLLGVSTLTTDYAEAASKSKVKLNKTSVTLKVGETVKLKLSGTDKKITWSSSNKKVAKVNKSGKVTALKKGKANITAKVGKKKYICKVKVEEVKSKNEAAKEVTYKKVYTNSHVYTSDNKIQFTIKELRKYSDGSYQVDVYIYNGFNFPVWNIQVTEMTLYDRNLNVVASAGFDPCLGLIIPGQSYVEWTFGFSGQYVRDGEFDFSTVFLDEYNTFAY